MKSSKSRLSNGVSTITFRHLVPKIRITKDFRFGVQKGGNGEYLGCQGRRRESYICNAQKYYLSSNIPQIKGNWGRMHIFFIFSKVLIISFPTPCRTCYLSKNSLRYLRIKLDEFSWFSKSSGAIPIFSFKRCDFFHRGWGATSFTPNQRSTFPMWFLVKLS